MRRSETMNRLKFIAFSVILGFQTFAPAASPAQLEEVTVTAVKEKSNRLPDVEETKVYSGKKTQLIELSEKPAIINNNYRQTLNQSPSLLLSEETSPLVSFGYRGLEPHRAQFTQVLKDGVPLHADMFSYPEAYYTPPLQSVETIEFIHGGGALLYGPQPGGALNYVTKNPIEGKSFEFYSENSAGSDSFYSSYTSISGTVNRLGYLGYGHYRKSDGVRASNSDFEVLNGSTKVVVKPDDGTQWSLAYDGYDEEHGEPGGLTRANFDSDPNQTTRLNDRFRLDRHYGVLSYQKEISPDLFLEGKVFGGYYKRFSKRQRGGGFGTLPSGGNANTNTIETQEFYTMGVEPRVRYHYDGFGSTGHTLTGGVLFYHSHSPRIDERGSSADAETGTVRLDADRTMDYLSFFSENRFQFGRLSLTPGVRLESIWQEVIEKINSDKKDAGTPLGSSEEFDFVPLFGLGLTYELRSNMELYSNLSQSYRPKIFTQAVPTDGTRIVNSDLEEGKAWQYEVGLSHSPTGYWGWDASLFYMNFEDQIGNDANTVANVGDAVHRGVELATQFDLVGWYDATHGTNAVDKVGSVNLYTSGMLLDAEFVKGSADGNEPQYAPAYLVKGGVDYRLAEKVKVTLGSTFSAKHYADDAHTPNRFIPSYKVWDLTGEWNVAEAFKVFAGINNLFDEHYYARVRGDGIDPAAERNFYGGATVRF